MSAKALARRFGGLTELASADRDEYFNGDINRIEGVSRAAGESALAFFARSENRTLVADLVAAGVKPPVER
jgi:NAD-dependent DNA ligase